MIKIGDPVTFIPAAFRDHSSGFPCELAAELTGRVIYINEAHHYYRVAFDMPGCIGHECFKFFDESEDHESEENTQISAVQRSQDLQGHPSEA